MEKTFTFNADYIARLGRKWSNPENARRPEHLATISANVAAIPFHIESLGDLAYQASASYSYSPEIGQLLQEISYTGHLAEFCTEILSARNDAAARDELRRYYEGYREKVLAHLAAQSRCISAFITGPAKFPTQRAEKANAAERRRLDEQFEWIERAQHAVKRNLGLLPDSGIIKSDDPEAVEKIREKLAEREALQERMKAANKIVRNKKLSDAEKLAALQAECRLSEKNAAEILHPTESYLAPGFDSYLLSNNNQEIHRLRGRLIQLERLREAAEKQAENGGAPEIEFDGGRIVDSAAENRVQIFFGGKPPAETRAELKSCGFRWAPSVGAWQAFRSSRALNHARRICGVVEA